MTSGGRSARRRPVSATHIGMLAGELAMVPETTPAGRRTRYSMSSMPPQDWPRMWTRSRPSASRTASTSRT